MNIEYQKLYKNDQEREYYYRTLQKLVTQYLTSSSIPDRFEVFFRNKEFSCVRDKKTGVQFFIKEDPEQKLEILRTLEKFMTRTGNWSFSVPLGFFREKGMVVYDYYETTLYDWIPQIVDPVELIQVIQRVLIGILQLNELSIIHLDLHLRNIFISGTDLETKWSFEISGIPKKWTFPGSDEVVIGDFGQSISRSDPAFLSRIAEFYRSFFPLFYYSNPDIQSLSWEFIDLWRFFRTLMNSLPRRTKFSGIYHFLDMSVVEIEIYLTSVKKEEIFRKFTIDFLNILELERVRCT